MIVICLIQRTLTKNDNAEDEFSTENDLNTCQDTQKVCAREDEAIKANLDLYKYNDVKDDFVKTNDLATCCHVEEKHGREDKATKADLDHHELKKVKSNSNVYIWNEK